MNYSAYKSLAMKIVIRSIIILFTAFIIFEEDSYAKEKKPLTAEDSLAIESWDRFSVNIGGFLAGLSNSIVAGSDQLGLGLALNLESALGLETSNLVLRGHVHYLFGRRHRHRVEIGYFGFFRNAYKVLEKEIEIGDEIYPVGTEISSKYNQQIFNANYDYAFYMDDRFNLGVSIGLYIMPLSFSVTTPNNTQRVADFTAPLPVLGLRTDFAITPKFTIKQSAELLYLKILDYEGRITDLTVRLEYTPFKHFGFGLGFDAYRLHVTSYEENPPIPGFIGTLRMDYTGLLFYVKYFF